MASIDEQFQKKYQRLRQILTSCGRVLIAYSGGVDSTLLLKVALDCLGPDHVLACLGIGDILSTDEAQNARQTAQILGANLQVVSRHEMENPEFIRNDPLRCYYCKKQIFQELLDLARRLNFPFVLSGRNADDQNQYRPGQKAEQELGILCPLEQAGLTKQDIRTLSRQFNLPTAEKPSNPCLATRIPYGMDITTERLRQIDKAEEFLRQHGFSVLRVRHHGSLARIEVPPEQISRFIDPDLRNQIAAFFKQIGFTYVSLDLQGFRSGSADEVLPPQS